MAVTAARPHAASQARHGGQVRRFGWHVRVKPACERSLSGGFFTWESSWDPAGDLPRLCMRRSTDGCNTNPSKRQVPPSRPAERGHVVRTHPTHGPVPAYDKLATAHWLLPDSLLTNHTGLLGRVVLLDCSAQMTTRSIS